VLQSLHRVVMSGPVIPFSRCPEADRRAPVATLTSLNRFRKEKEAHLNCIVRPIDSETMCTFEQIDGGVFW
jgi:hypothetical protein